MKCEHHNARHPRVKDTCLELSWCCKWCPDCGAIAEPTLEQWQSNVTTFTAQDFELPRAKP